jgi:crossover junction endodeoxyribonuclease RuvC
MNVLGIDSGSQRLGYAVLTGNRQKPVIAEAGVIRPKGKTLCEKLCYIVEDVAGLLVEYQIETLSIETAFVGPFPRAVIVLAHIRGAIIGLVPALRLNQLPTLQVVEPTPGQVKSLVTGKQNASKQLMQQAIQWQFKLAKPPEPPDVADAIGIALWGMTISVV